ncbi:hypothetical protein RradSPS_2284 [Rubrobacter radiotolerans]|uniref:DUF1802 family protein n=1 Tax=Rubrobacter radiotolerans TaxID=42256 RepID=A0A023X554_RUBRA|nr:DUF1802 family protein [Rubrobacter radiotolerans]AHY47567.1 hypothetical protein RradSPS_2284 [Rubrobacter radiotolerans]MDX5894972.1 DUF1802 family protein [Rubrobacter radiotolerans]SMC07167.1 hypothetical protein SAMN00767673_2287 [Rubrobacter radiotolerans DSM 5868]
MNSVSRTPRAEPLDHALKEWAVAVRALEAGRTVLVVRKGGIREKSFAVPESRFLLLPGFEHQRPELVKPDYRDLMEGLEHRSDSGPLRFTSFVEVVGAYEVSEKGDLDALSEHHMWTDEYAESRFKWRPKKPLTALVLRTFLLPEEVILPFRDSYGGCKSFVSLEDVVGSEGARPALSDAEFERLASPLLEVLEGLAPARVGG